MDDRTEVTPSVSVGTLVRLRRPCLGNEEGAWGVCYEVYKIGDRPGYSFIFENLQYDGFSPTETDRFLQISGTCARLRDYVFRNVLQLRADAASPMHPLGAFLRGVPGRENMQAPARFAVS